MESVQKQLEELGLSPNEVRVYLASLELGAATAQQLAAKAAVARPTTYVAIGGLKKRGLLSAHTRGKKEYVQAERPEVLSIIVSEEKHRVEKNAEKLKSLLPRLHALIAVSGARPEVSYFEGVEGLRTMRAVLFSVRASELFVIGSPEKYQEVAGRDEMVLHDHQLSRTKLRIRQISIYEKKKLPLNVANAQCRYIRADAFEAGEIAVFGDYISLIAYLDKPYGFLVKSHELASVAARLFNAAWKGAERS